MLSTDGTRRKPAVEIGNWPAARAIALVRGTVRTAAHTTVRTAAHTTRQAPDRPHARRSDGRHGQGRAARRVDAEGLQPNGLLRESC